MMTGSYFGFLLNAGHVGRTSRDLFLRVHNWNSTRGKPCVNRMDLRAFIYVPEGYREGIATGIALGLARIWKKKEQFQALHANMNEPIVFQRYCKASLLVVYRIAFHGSEPLSKQKSASQEDAYNNTLAGFSDIDIITTITIPLAPAIGVQ